MAVRSVPLNQYQYIDPPVAWGEDVVLRCNQLTTGPYGTPATDITAWTLGVDASFLENGPPDPLLSAISVQVVSATQYYVIVPAAVTRPFTQAKTIFAEVWRLDAGNRRPLRRYAFPTYDPERDA